MHGTRQRRRSSGSTFIQTACALAVTVLAVAVTDAPAYAQQAEAAVPTSDAASTAPSPPKMPMWLVGKLPLDSQVRWLARAAQSGMLAKQNDGALVSLFKSLDPLTVPRYLKDGPNGYPSYEFTLIRRERIKGSWPDQADHMLVRVTRNPMRIYAKWLPDGAHAGQEMLYDDTTRPDEMVGHLGGVLNVVTMWAALDGAFARSQSRHSVRDLGTEYIVQQYLSEAQKFADIGVTRPGKIEVKTMEGVRVVAFTYETPPGQTKFYARREVLGLDLRHPYFRTAESYGDDGKIFESLVFQTITPKVFDDGTFSMKNPDYKF